MGFVHSNSTIGSWLRSAVVAVPLACLWFRLIDNLRLEWATNPQYSYGWVVPFLCVTLLVRRWLAFPETESQKAESRKSEGEIAKANGKSPNLNSVVTLFAFLALLYLPTRLMQEATPEWRLISWSLAIEVVVLTMIFVRLALGGAWAWRLAFPICFFLIAVPWPTHLETPLIQGLTRANVGATIECVGWLGIPASQHGNVIEVSTGTVGVNEACSGIRSFQTSLMISLFWGELYGLCLRRRLLLLPVGFIAAFVLNLCRTSLLVSVAWKNGIAAIDSWHDSAGLTISVACSLLLWGAAWLLWRTQKPLLEKQKAESMGQGSEAGNQLFSAPGLTPPISRGGFPFSRFPLSEYRRSTVQLLGLVLLLWLVTVEAGTELWYHHLESRLAPSPRWSVVFPQGNATLKNLPIADASRELLRFDDGRQAAWIESDGTVWQAFYFNWLPGKVAGYLAKRHTPEICLQATGLKMSSGPELAMMKVNGVELPVRSYVFESENGRFDVFHCRWESGVAKSAYVEHESKRFNLVRGIWAGRGNQGQKVLEIIISGYADAEQAKVALVRQLQTLIKVEKHAEVDK